MPSPLAQLLAGLFPSIPVDPLNVPGCWVSKFLGKDPQNWLDLSAAIEVVTQHRQLPALKQRLKDVHPVDRPHQEQYDYELLDCLAEACAFAWADMRRLGSPKFIMVPGAPDVYVDSTLWVEAKNINLSEESKKFVKQMPRKVEGTVDWTAKDLLPGLIRKFESDFDDAKRKFERQVSGRYAIFFNLQLDVLKGIIYKSELQAELNCWADSKRANDPGIEIVICYNYYWQEPFRDPFRSS